MEMNAYKIICRSRKWSSARIVYADNTANALYAFVRELSDKNPEVPEVTITCRPHEERKQS